MDGIIPTVDPNKCLKTYAKADKTTKKPSEVSKTETLQLLTVSKEQESKDLTTKEALKFLLEGTLKSKVCRYCLKIVSHLSSLDLIIHVAGKGVLYKVTIKDIVASFHPFKVEDDPNFPDRICEKCLDRAITSYLFTQQCDRAERALRNCFDDMYDKLNKLDPLERTKKRGRQKQNPNPNILYAEHNKVIDYAEPIINIVNTASEVLTEQMAINELECLKCCEILPNIESLINHTTIHSKSMWYNCRLCGTSFPKRHNLKKHFNLKHGPNTTRKTAEYPQYDCKRCMLTFEKYYNYLQHIEKHKFKTVMEHLIQKKMDKLCSLCFGKGVKMVDLDEKICLHGGSPELTGERSLYTVLASTLPEKKNKYQELLVPAQASVTQLIKKKKHGASEYSLSNPIIITVENVDCHDLCIFVFSEPLLLNPINVIETNISDINKIIDDDKNVNIDKSSPISQDVFVSVSNKTETENITNDFNVGTPLPDDDLMKNQATDVETQTVTTTKEIMNFTFSNPDSINIDINVKASEIATSIKVTDIENTSKPSCKENLIYYDKVSSDGQKNIDTLSKENSLINVGPKVLPCKVCWVFKHLNKCELCGKLNNKKINENIDLIEEIHIESETSSIATENLQNEKKCDTWLCNICLTNNKKCKEICDCCDAKPLLNTEREVLTFTGKITDFIKDNNQIQTREEIKEEKQLDVFNEKNLNTHIEEINNNQLEIKEETKPLLCVNDVFPNNNINCDEEVSLMDTEMIEPENSHNFIPSNIYQYNFMNLHEEAMDVQIPETIDTDITKVDTNVTQIFKTDLQNTESNMTDSTNAIHVPNVFDNNNAFLINQFQFNVGRTDKSKKYKKKINKPRY